MVFEIIWFLNHQSITIRSMTIFVDNDTESAIGQKSMSLSSEEIKPLDINFSHKFFYSNGGRLYLNVDNAILRQNDLFSHIQINYFHINRYLVYELNNWSVNPSNNWTTMFVCCS